MTTTPLLGRQRNFVSVNEFVVLLHDLLFSHPVISLRDWFAGYLMKLRVCKMIYISSGIQKGIHFNFCLLVHFSLARVTCAVAWPSFHIIFFFSSLGVG